MCLSSKIAELRNELLRSCKYATHCLEAAERRVSYSASVTSSDQTRTITDSSTPPVTSLSTPLGTVLSIQPPQMSGAKTDDATSYEITDKEILNRFMILTHGVLIQEWERFLYDVFVEGVIYYLRGYDLDPDCKLHLRNLKPGIEVTEMRKNLSTEVEKSHRGYKELFYQSRKLFKVQEDNLLKEMQKHVQIRHIFQHSQGEIRKEDLKDIGLNGPNVCFSILGDDGRPLPYKVGQTIFLSKKEIQNLYDTIEKFSQAFQTQAEKAKPIAE